MPHYWPYNWHWFVSFFGVLNTSSPQYGLWSGVAGSFLSTIMVNALVFIPLYMWHHNCHQHKCPRVGRHEYHGKSGTTWKYCRKHHPEIQGGHHDVRTHPDTAHHFTSRDPSLASSDQPSAALTSGADQDH